MRRDVRGLADTHFDVAIIGCGFYGALAAWDASLRGLSVALIDQGDAGGATSFNNLKTLHGGLRSLQSGNLPQMRLFIRERRALATIAPHLLQPLSFVVPTSRHPARSRAAMRAALALNDSVAYDRDRGVRDPALHLPRGRVLSRAECLQRNPLISEHGVTGGALWHDYQMRNADRMTFSVVRSAVARGAVFANYVQADSLQVEQGRVTGVRVRDVLSTDTFDLRARVVLNAAGPWAASLLAGISPPAAAPTQRLSLAMNLVLQRLTVTQGCGGRARGRFFFLVPWREVTLAGTSHEPHDGSPGAIPITRWHVEAFLADLREAFPHAGLSSADVKLVHRGLLPMLRGDEQHVTLLKESQVVDHGAHGLRGLVSMFGVRYTTARHTAAVATDAVCRALGHGRGAPSRTAVTPVHGGDIESTAALLAGAERDTPVQWHSVLPRLTTTYGSDYRDVLALLTSDPTMASPLGEHCLVTAGEIVHAVRHEAAVRLSDALIRRTEAGSAGHPGNDALSTAARLVARELGWSDERSAVEIDAVNAFYRLS